MAAGVGAAIAGAASGIFDVIGSGLNLAATKRTNEANKAIAAQQTKQFGLLADLQRDSEKAQAQNIKTIVTYLLIIVALFILGWIVVKTVSDK